MGYGLYFRKHGVNVTWVRDHLNKCGVGFQGGRDGEFFPLELGHLEYCPFPSYLCGFGPSIIRESSEF